MKNLPPKRLRVSKRKELVFLLVCLIAVNGCAGKYLKMSKRADRNSQAVGRLKLAMLPPEVIASAGRPDKEEIYIGGRGELIIIYLYITKVTKRGLIRRQIKTDYTPFVFENNKLAGWGWNYLKQAARKYKFNPE